MTALRAQIGALIDDSVSFDPDALRPWLALMGSNPTTRLLGPVLDLANDRHALIPPTDALVAVFGDATPRLYVRREIRRLLNDRQGWGDAVKTAADWRTAFNNSGGPCAANGVLCDQVGEVLEFVDATRAAMRTARLAYAEVTGCEGSACGIFESDLSLHRWLPATCVEDLADLGNAAGDEVQQAVAAYAQAIRQTSGDIATTRGTLDTELVQNANGAVSTALQCLDDLGLEGANVVAGGLAEYVRGGAPGHRLFQVLIDRLLGTLLGEHHRRALPHARRIVEATGGLVGSLQTLQDGEASDERRAAAIQSLAGQIVTAVVSAIRLAGGDHPVLDALGDLAPLVDAIVARDPGRILSQSLTLLARVGSAIANDGAIRTDVGLRFPDAMNNLDATEVRRLLGGRLDEIAQCWSEGAANVTFDENGHATQTATVTIRDSGDPQASGINASISRCLTPVLAELPHTTNGEAMITIEFQLDRAQSLRSIVPARVVRALAFGAELSSAESSEDVSELVNAFAAPVGSYRTKRTRWGVYLGAMVGGVAGGEWYVDRSRNTLPTDNPSFGWHASLGFDVSFPLCNRGNPLCNPVISTIGLYIPVLNLGPFMSFAGDQRENLPSFEGLSLVAPGALVRLHLFDSPFVVGFGFNYVPELRRFDYRGTDGSPQTEFVSAIQLVGILAVDVTLFPF